jgi:hypothetical protein
MSDPLTWVGNTCMLALVAMVILSFGWKFLTGYWPWDSF